jgi:predicted RNase H-like HicB family nuclease
MTEFLTCIAKGHDGHWEAICLDLNIATQGQSLREVQRLLGEAIRTYIEDACKEDDATRDQLLSRQAPLHVRLYWTCGLLLATLTGRRLTRAGERDGNASSATVPFAIPCPA